MVDDDYNKQVWSTDAMWDEEWPDRFPDAPVVIPVTIAQWAMRHYPLAGNMGLGEPVIKARGWLFHLWFAGEGQWWMVKLGEVTA